MMTSYARVAGSSAACAHRPCAPPRRRSEASTERGPGLTITVTPRDVRTQGQRSRHPGPVGRAPARRYARITTSRLFPLPRWPAPRTGPTWEPAVLAARRGIRTGDCLACPLEVVNTNIVDAFPAIDSHAHVLCHSDRRHRQALAWGASD